MGKNKYVLVKRTTNDLWNLNSFSQKKFHHFRIFVDDRDGEGRPAERVQAVNVEEVVLVLEHLHQLRNAGAVAAFHKQHETLLFRRQHLDWKKFVESNRNLGKGKVVSKKRAIS